MLSLKDMAGIKPKSDWSSLDCLSAVASMALNKYNEENSQERKGKKHHPKFSEANCSKQIHQNQRAPPDKGCYGGETSRAKNKQKITKPAVVLCPENIGFPELPLEFKNKLEEIGATQVLLVIQKNVTHTDVDKAQGRLSMPIKQIRNEFLSLEEKEFLCMRIGGKPAGMHVLLIEPSLEQCLIEFKKWDMVKPNGGPASSSYVFMKPWTEIKLRNTIQAGRRIQVWSFRIKEDLGFLINVL